MPADVTAYLERFQINETQLRNFMTGPSGPVMRDLARRAIRIEGLAKHNATRRPGPNVITGRLRGSITWRLGVDALGPYADIGTAVEYAGFVEGGTTNAPPYPFLRPALEASRGL